MIHIQGFDWDDRNREHIGRHDVEPEEAEEIFLGRRLIFRSREGRYIAFGRSATGRYLIVAFALSEGVARIICRAMTTGEKKAVSEGIIWQRGIRATDGR